MQSSIRGSSMAVPDGTAVAAAGTTAGTAAGAALPLPGIESVNDGTRPPAIWRRLLRHRLFMTGAVIFGIMLFLALFADWLQLLPPEKMQVRMRFKMPDFRHPLGTDNYG